MLTIVIEQGVKVCVAADLGSMTTYVLLEQEDWFEQEMSFVRPLARPGMRMLDVGANHGVYALTFAHGLRGSGHVWAFEPTSEPFGFLSRGIQANGFGGVATPVQFGLSNCSRQAEIGISTTSELNSLHTRSGRTELVRLETLDTVAPALWGGRAIDFVKLDAEGEEIGILEGGRGFLSNQSPLIMFELKHGDTVNEGLLAKLIHLGYGLYRLVPGLNLLVPVEPAGPFDGFQLNLFAAKPDCALALSQRGLLSLDASSSCPATASKEWEIELGRLPFSAPALAAWKANMSASGSDAEEHRVALNAYLSALDPKQAPEARVALLTRSAAAWERLSQRTPGKLSFGVCLARARYDLGQRAAAVELLKRVAQTVLTAPPEAYSLPFLPPLAAFDARPVVGTHDDWLKICLLEAGESWRAFSSFFDPSTAKRLQSIIGNGNLSAGMRRRILLSAHRSGISLPGTALRALQQEAPDNRNAWFWRELNPST